MVPYYNHNPRTEISFQDEDTHRIASIPRMPMSRQNKTQNVGTQCCLTENTFTLLPKESFLGRNSACYYISFKHVLPVNKKILALKISWIFFCGTEKGFLVAVMQ